MQAFRRGEEIGRTKEKDYKGNETTVVHYRKDRYVEEHRFSEIGKIRLSKDVTGICADASARGQAAITLHRGQVEVPIILAVDDVDTVLAALAVASFGLTTFWINRGKQPMDELRFPADKEVEKITDLPALLRAA